MKKNLALAFFLLLTCACAAKLRTQGLPMARKAPMDLPSLAFLQQPVAATLDVEVQNRGKIYRFPAQVEMDGEALVMVGLTPVGSRAFTLTYQDDRVTYDAILFFNLPLPPDRLLLAYLLLALPEPDLKQHAENFGFRLQQNPDETRLVHSGTEVARLISRDGNIQGGEVVFHHLREGYVLRIKTLQWEPF